VSATTDVGDALRVLLDPALEPIVEVVLVRDGDALEAHAADGSVRFDRDGAVLSEQGRNPLADQATDRFAGLANECASLQPDRSANSYPFAYEQAAQLFDHPCAPDLCVIHTAAHNWEDQGGHRGEHGSIDVVQARAPFIIAGAGVRSAGMVARAAKLVDVVPTLLRLMGAAPPLQTDGIVLDDVLLADGSPPEHVIGFLWDGCNPNVLYDAVANGDAPNVGRLMAMGTTYEHGAMASLPTVTLANHTSVLTGLHPGHHGILHNAWWDSNVLRQVITNSPATWHEASSWLFPGVETMHDAVHRTWPDACTVSINEPTDAGADFSTFDFVRRGVALERPPAPDELPYADQRFVRPVKEYRWSSRVDHTTVQQFKGVWSGHYLGSDWARPKFTWCNFSLTDAAFHEGGPHSDIALASIRDSDARLGQILDVVEQSGAWDRTAFFLVADHGMEETDPAVTGDWSPALTDAGISHRDEAFGFIYLT
jgi:predicted AlkP superfamily pyrophosphatase or phosphodiesterase